ncbi:hypothetical protein [Brevundimonas nasdae]|uniref:SatD family (SatD) n=1 Tax=Brevundimonas nasdae TaxID=172043 RepID=A0ABX8TJT8_9CAUL|nr:hypothetical protein [Brevundimonas nasdae]QYC11466.1 hypothetical protein KWG56_05685 [Brevundimonas nasdae]QYC14254.1 hypothetical protein KWG63_01020 [Brevundimonas nasdae]
MTPPIVAVLTGDIVNSTKMSAEDLVSVRGVLERAATDAGGWSHRPTHGPDFYRGDAWQLVLEDPHLFLRTAVWLKASLIASDLKAQTRIAIGIGAAEAIDQDMVSRSLGEAFTQSGRTLDAMGKRRDMGFVLPAALGQFDWLPAQVTVCDYIVSRWTRSQAEVALPLLRPDAPTQAEAAEALDRHPQSISRVYRDAGLYALLEVLALVEALPFDRLGAGSAT